VKSRRVTAAWLPLGPAAALYLLAAGRGAAAPWTARAVCVVAGLSVACLGATAAQVGFVSPHLWLAVLGWAAAWFAGERTRLRREQVAELERRATRAEHEAARERLLAVAEERARIARDLHDSADHALNVIAVRAGAARLRHGRDPDRSLGALTAIEQLARQTVAEIDQFVGSLREPGLPCRAGLRRHRRRGHRHQPGARPGPGTGQRRARADRHARAGEPARRALRRRANR
jgi:signal transduction histidine kinase